MTSFNLFPNHISQKATIRVMSSVSDAFSIPPLAYISHAPFLSNERPIPMRFADFVDLPRISTANSVASEFEVFYIRSQSDIRLCLRRWRQHEVVRDESPGTRIFHYGRHRCLSFSIGSNHD
mmetsp:Transcript_19505/g.39463  ORF Transcript_19505/g.39463 Transcript_19505/m.39463 type:complete len:122 (-) Transcript_19505:102-467(-)